MAIDKFSLFNNALLLIGQRELESVTEDRPPRHYLDNAYDDPSAVDQCLELVQPRFASKTITLNTPSVSPDHGLDSVHSLPSDYIKIVGVFSDDKLDQPISRYLIEDRTIVCEFDTIFLRYTTNGRAFTSWTPTFAQLVSIFLGRQVAFKLNPAIFEDVHALFLDTLETVKTLEGEKEPVQRSSAPTVTLTNAWRHIYNGALQIMGLDEINTNTDDSNRRAKLDTALNAELVSSLLEETGWQFALKGQKITFDPSQEPDWGYRRVFQKPADLHRLDGVFSDEYMQSPIKAYHDEQSRWYSDHDLIFVQYVSDDFIVNPSQWPTFFKRMVMARLAKDASMSLRAEGADVAKAEDEYRQRKSEAEANDAMQSPPRRISRGNWVASRYRGAYRNRPGDR